MESMQSELDLTAENISEFCRRWRVDELSLDRDQTVDLPAADPHLSVRFEPEAEWSFAERLRMQREFQLLSGREVRFRRAPYRRRNRFSRLLFDS